MNTGFVENAHDEEILNKITVLCATIFVTYRYNDNMQRIQSQQDIPAVILKEEKL